MNKSNIGNYSLPRSIVLLGMMGAGKTSVGRALADIIAAPFFDADREIEAAAGRSAASIFTDYGEGEFRRMERLVIARLLGGAPCILSLGGGAFIDAETRARIKQTALSVWLKVDHDLLLKRVLRHGERPMLKGGDAQEKMQKILADREPIYAEADITIPCDDRPVAQTAQAVWDAVSDRL